MGECRWCGYAPSCVSLACLLREFFFFQAEDGIRDSSVTGVQTCALPISIPQRHSEPEPAPSDAEESCPLMCPGGQDEAQHDQPPMRCPRFDRSDECGGCRGATYEQMPSVLENLQNLAAAQQLRAKARRLAEDGFPPPAPQAFQQPSHPPPPLPPNPQ